MLEISFLMMSNSGHAVIRNGLEQLIKNRVLRASILNRDTAE